LITQSILPLRFLDKAIDELWVSTEALRHRLSYASPRVLGPAPKKIEPIQGNIHNSAAKTEIVTVAYHATAIHTEEHRFLRSIISAALAARPRIRFEVIAAGKSAELWINLGSDRVIVKQPLPWDEYVRSQNKKIDIMLVPQSPSHLNECRAETKRIDVARVGAAGLFSECPAFSPASEGEILLPYKQSLWIEHLINLADDEDARRRVALATQQRVEMMVARGAAGIPAIRPWG
jgi:hypothetical protein